MPDYGCLEGMELFLEPGREVLLARDGDEVLEHLRMLTPARARALGSAAYRRVLAEHTYPPGGGSRGRFGRPSRTGSDVMKPAYDVVILGLSVTSSWGNGHATTYRSLIRGLAKRGHRVLFLERNAPWYAGNRDEPNPVGARTEIYESFDELTARWEDAVTAAGLVIVGSFVPEGARVGDWALSVAQGVCAYYDIDTPVTFTRLAEGCREFLTPELIRRYQIYLSFTGGPVLRRIESEYGSPMARALYCSVDPDQYRPSPRAARWDLGIWEPTVLTVSRRWSSFCSSRRGVFRRAIS